MMAYVCHKGKQFSVNCIVVYSHMRWARQKEGTQAAVWIKLTSTYHRSILETVVWQERESMYIVSHGWMRRYA